MALAQDGDERTGETRIRGTRVPIRFRRRVCTVHQLTETTVVKWSLFHLGSSDV
jgi:hypothetical protein